MAPVLRAANFPPLSFRNEKLPRTCEDLKLSRSVWVTHFCDEFKRRSPHFCLSCWALKRSLLFTDANPTQPNITILLAQKTPSKCWTTAISLPSDPGTLSHYNACDSVVGKTHGDVDTSDWRGEWWLGTQTNERMSSTEHLVVHMGH